MFILITNASFSIWYTAKRLIQEFTCKLGDLTLIQKKQTGKVVIKKK